MTLPNLLLVGAAKSGTTSLYHYLNEHPEIYMAHPKEPRFFSYCGSKKFNSIAITDFSDYQKIFNGTAKEKIIGEASVNYLYYHQRAIKNIKKYLPNYQETKIIVIVRQPAHRAFSHYCHDLSKKLTAMPFEIATHHRPFYLGMSLYSEAIQNYLDNFNQVKILFYDDLCHNPNQLIKEVYHFLKINDDFTPKTEIHYNVTNIPRNKIIHNILNLSYKVSSKIIAPKELRSHSKISNIIEKTKNKLSKKIPLNHKTKILLLNYFKSDIAQLEKITNRDLSSWLTI